MVVVSNTSPLHYFIAVQQVDVLPQLFTKVHVPQAVVRELSQPGTPAPIRRWIENRPAYQKRVLNDPMQVFTTMRAKGFRIGDKLAARFEQLLRTSYAR